MPANSYGRPDPPPPEPIGNIITRFNGWVDSSGTSPKGHLWFRIGITNTEKWKAMLMTEYPGQVLHFEVSLRTILKPEDIIDIKESQADVGDKIRAALGMGVARDVEVADALDWSDGAPIDWSEPDKGEGYV